MHAATGKWTFNGRTISAAYWDGEENFERVRDYDEDQARVDRFGSWLEEQDPDAHLTQLDRKHLEQQQQQQQQQQAKANREDTSSESK